MALFPAMLDVMVLRVIGHGPHGSTRYVAVSLPLIRALLEDGRYFLPGEIPAADAGVPPAVFRRRRTEAARRRARALRDIEESRAVTAAVDWIRKRERGPHQPRSRAWNAP